MVRIVRIALIALLMGAYAAGYAFSAPHTDTADELLRAFEIRHAIAFPIQGPPLGQVMHLGPLWFYLVAGGLSLHGSWLGAALFVGFICSLKFPLAYWCGERLLDARFGLLWALCLFAPGWTSFEQLVFLNPNAIAAAELATLAVYLRNRANPSIASLAALGFMLAVTAHVHPTAAPMAVLAVAIRSRFRSNRGNVVAATFAFAVSFALPFVPYLLSQWQAGFPDSQAVSGYVDEQISARNALRAPAILWAYFSAGPSVLARYVVGLPGRVSSAIGWGNAALALALAVAGLTALRERARVLLLCFLAALFVEAAWVGAMRPATPLQFTWVIGPWAGAVLALGLWSIGSATWGRFAVAAAALVLVAFNLLFEYALAAQVERGEGMLPSRIMDIQGRLPHSEYRDVWFPAWAHERLGDLLCRAPKPLGLHGPLAYIVDKDVGLDMLLSCQTRSGVVLGGSTASRHLVGMTMPFWKASGMEPDCLIGSLGIANVAVPVASSPLVIAAGDTYLPRKPSGEPPRPVTFTFPVKGHERVLVTNMLGGYEGFRWMSAQISQTRVSPSITNDLSVLLLAPGTVAPDAQWKIEVESTNPAGLDVVAIAQAADQNACKGANLR